MSQLYELGLNIKTIGDAEAKDALAKINEAGKQTSVSLGGLEASTASATRQMGFWGAIQAEAAGHMGEHELGVGRLERALGEYVGHAEGANHVTEMLSASLLKFGLGTVETVGLLAGAAGLIGAYEMVTSSERDAEAASDKLTDSLTKQREAILATTTAGRALTLEIAKRHLAEVESSAGGLGSQLKGGLESAFGAVFGKGFGAGAVNVAIEEANKLKHAHEGIEQAANASAKGIQDSNNAAARAYGEQVRALSTIIKLGQDVDGDRQRALKMLGDITAAMHALPIDDTIGRAGFAGEIKELNEALFPKLHEHVKKLKKELSELSPLATAPHVGLTMSEGVMGAARTGDVLSTDMIFGDPTKHGSGMPNIKENPATKFAVESIHQQTEEVAKAITEQGKIIAHISEEASKVFAQGLEAGFIEAFSGHGIGAAIKAFGKTIIAGLGTIMQQQGEALLSYGIAQEGLALGLSNPFTAGPSAIAAGVALIALGAAFGALAHGGGTKSSPAFSNAQSSANNVVRLKFVDRNGNPVDGLTPRPTINATIIGVNDATTNRAVKQMIVNADRR